MQAELRVARRRRRAASTPSSCARRGSTARSSRPARRRSSAWSAPAGSRSSATAASAARWSTSTTSSQGVVARRADADAAPGAAWWIADAEPYEINEIVATVGRALRAEGFDVAPNRLRLPARRRARRRAGRRAHPARPAATSQQVHVLGEMDKTIACDISVARAELGYEPDRRPRGGHAPEHPLVPRPGHRAVTTTSLVTGGNGYFGQLLVDRLVERGDDVRLLDIDVTGAARRGVERDRGRHPRRRRRARRRRRRRRRVPQRRPGAARPRPRPAAHRSTSTAPQTLLDACRDAGVGKVVHTSSSAVFGVPESNPVLPTTVPAAAGGVRPRQAGRRVGVPAGRRRRAST